ncbi:Protein kinase domain-containing protein [Thermomonospora echinospora]|uniref:non-specific serine/threonine protein kinase n=2 Tax=Thermomonospora echinospora TaxID=1992 RepID=A0A1H6CHV3_9ACTN|nr:Protein kinase domain-containing protein [Thermomonospora echinospora]
MGAVWRARDMQLDREVAVKELRLPEHLGAAQREKWIARLDREARAAARLKHPGIITVHDLVKGDDGRPWIVMESVHGGSLDDLLKARGPLTPQQVAAIGLRMLDALHAAHRAGIIHRDIKPANVLLEGDRVILTDFGIAALGDDAALTRSGEVMGTPAFMSPEQVRGLPTSAATDLWSLGATLYTAVEGRPPFPGTSTGAVFVAIATEDPAPAAHAGPLEPVINGLLRKDPAQRLTAEQVHPMLLQLGASPPAHAAVHGHVPAQAPAHWPPPPVPGTPTAYRGKPLWAVLAVAAVAVVAAALVFAFVIASGGDSAYENNLSIAEKLGAPSGYTRTSEKNVGGGRAQVTLARTCTTGCSGPATADHPAFKAVREWLVTRPGIAAVSPAMPALDRKSCIINVQPVRTPGVIKVQVVLRDDKTLLQIEVA